MRALALLVAVALAGMAGGASAAPSLTLNGVAIDGITDHRFENCTVVIDAQGNVHIEAMGYAVKGAEETRPAEPPSGGPRTTPAALDGQATTGKLTRRYFLVTEHTPPGTQYQSRDFQRLFEHSQTRSGIVKGNAKHVVFAFAPTRPQRQHQPPAAEVIDMCAHPGGQYRLAKRHRGNHRAKFDALRMAGGIGQ
jgi:hypothetical protein